VGKNKRRKIDIIGTKKKRKGRTVFAPYQGKRAVGHTRGYEVKGVCGVKGRNGLLKKGNNFGPSRREKPRKPRARGGPLVIGPDG